MVVLLLAQTRDISGGYLRNNAPRLISYGIYGLFNVLLFVYAAHRYADRGTLVQLARGCGACMNFNAAFCLLPMMRLFISRLRRTYPARYLALEETIGFHRLCAPLGNEKISAAQTWHFANVAADLGTPESQRSDFRMDGRGKPGGTRTRRARS